MEIKMVYISVTVKSNWINTCKVLRIMFTTVIIIIITIIIITILEMTGDLERRGKNMIKIGRKESGRCECVSVHMYCDVGAYQNVEITRNVPLFKCKLLEGSWYCPHSLTPLCPPSYFLAHCCIHNRLSINIQYIGNRMRRENRCWLSHKLWKQIVKSSASLSIDSHGPGRLVFSPKTDFQDPASLHPFILANPFLWPKPHCIICRPQCKMKMQSPLFKTQEKMLR